MGDCKLWEGASEMGVRTASYWRDFRTGISTETRHVKVCAVDLDVMAGCSGYRVMRGSGIWIGSGQGSMGSSRSA